MKYGKAQEKSVRRHKLVKKAIGEIKEGFTGIFKLTKWLAIEFGVMSLALGAVELAFYAAQIAAKAWNFTLNALGAAAGVAVGGLTAVMAALRQLQTARMQPLFGAQRMGGRGAASQMNMLLGDPRLGMFDDASLIGAIESARRSGMEVNVKFRQAMEQLGNFAVIGTGDPSKNLGALVGALGQINTEGKVTRDTFDEIAKTSPELARAFGKLAGSKATDPKHMLKAGQNAADAGKISAQRFTEALMSGELGAQYANVLDSVNQTLIGRFKSQWKRMKQALVEVGNPILDIFNDGNQNPIDQFGNRIRFTLYQLSPVLTREFQRLNSKLFGDKGLGLFDNMIDASVRRIYSGLPRLIGWGEGFFRIMRGIRDWFKSMGPWFQKMDKWWDNFYEGFARPIGMEIFETVKYAINRFGEAMSKVDTAGFAQAIGSIGDGVRNLIDHFNRVREVLSPIVEGLLRFFGVLLKNPITSWLAIIALLGAAFLKLELAIFRLGFAWEKASLDFQRGAMGMSRSEQLLAAEMERKNIRALAQQRILEGVGTTAVVTAEELQVMTASERAAMGGAGVPGKPSRWSNMKAGLSGALPLAAMLAGTYIQGKAAPTSAAGQGLGMAMTMGGTGAMIGTMVGGPGAGTAIGAAIGGLSGAVMGLWGATDALRKQREEELAKGAKEKDETYRDAVAQVTGKDASSGSVRMAAYARMQVGRKALKDSGILDRFDQFKDKNRLTKKGSEEWRWLGSVADIFTGDKKIDGMILNKSQRAEYRPLKAAKDNYDQLTRALEDQGPEIERLSGNYEILGGVLGMNADQIDEWAQRTGTDLANLRLTTEDLFKKVLGYGEDALANLGIAAGRLRDALQGPVKRLQDLMDTRISADEAWQDIKYAGPMSAEQATARAAEFINTRTDYVTAQVAAGRYKGKGGARQAQREFYSPEAKIAMLRQIQDPGMQAAVGKAFDLAAAAYAEQLKPENIMSIDPEVAASVRDRLSAYEVGATQSWRATPGGGFHLGDSITESEKSKILGGDRTVAAGVGRRAQQDALMGTGVFAGNQNADVRAAVLGMDPAAVGQMMANKFYDPANPNNIENQLKSGGAAAAQMLRDAITGALEATDWKMPTFTATVAQDGTMTWTQVGDTSTARGGAYGDTSSRWARTFGSHSRYNQMVPGSRTITSGVRNYALGSPSSDHRFGRAYDLTGDNLGMYAGQVRSDGGFAEFHGSAGGRHLHVVPSPTAAGDTSVPASIGVRSSSGGSSMTQTVSFNITAGPNASPEEIARAVMVKLRQAERSAQERL